MKDLTNFQVNCEKKLLDALSSVNSSFQRRSIEGQNEIFIHALIRSSDIEVWIYEDEAMLSGNNIDLRFEAPDYDTDEELIDHFIKGVLSSLSGANGPR